jgi:hypothetical protein
MDAQARGPRKVGCEYWCGYWRKHYTVLAFGENTITIRWEDGQVTTHRTAWDQGRDLIVRPADHQPLGREYSVDGNNWHFAPNIARQLART